MKGNMKKFTRYWDLRIGNEKNNLYVGRFIFCCALLGLLGFFCGCATAPAPNQSLITWQEPGDKLVTARATLAIFMKANEWDKTDDYAGQFEVSLIMLTAIAAEAAKQELDNGHCDSARRIISHYQLEVNDLPPTCGLKFMRFGP